MEGAGEMAVAAEAALQRHAGNVAAALGQAIGEVPTRLPFLPEAVLDAIDARTEKASA